VTFRIFGTFEILKSSRFQTTKGVFQVFRSRFLETLTTTPPGRKNPKKKSATSVTLQFVAGEAST
jgi:hypothetical protein